jgi:hypothetical protein
MPNKRQKTKIVANDLINELLKIIAELDMRYG